MHVQVLAQQHFHLNVRRGLQSHLEESCFLMQEPLSQLFIAAIRKAIDKMGNCVIAAEL
jgi:hypothetical protein